MSTVLDNRTGERAIRGCDVAGPPDGHPIVLLHAASYTRKIWLVQVRDLAAAGYRVYAPDLPGHGERCDDAFDYSAALDFLEAFLALHVRRPALLVGVSLGGCLSVDVSPRCPARIAGMILSGSSFDARGRICRLVLTGESIVFRALERQLIARFNGFLRRTQPPEIADAIIAAGSYWHAAARAVEQMRGRDFIASLRQYGGPVMIANGARDIVHRSAERAFAHAAADARVRPIPGGNHVCNLDRAQDFTQTVAAFANSVFGAAERSRWRVRLGASRDTSNL